MQSQSARDEPLDIALSVGQRLQNALDSAKHGITNVVDGRHCLTIKDILYGDIADTKTITVHNNTSRLVVLFKWYSMCNVRLRDIYLSLTNKQLTEVCIDKTKMDLYVLDEASVIEGILVNNKDISVKHCNDSGGDGLTLCISNPPPDILNRIVRRTSLNCNKDEWNVIGTSGTIYTVFSGDRFENVMMYANDTISTDVGVTVSYMGKVCV
jgi:hypothetical protein